MAHGSSLIGRVLPILGAIVIGGGGLALGVVLAVAAVLGLSAMGLIGEGDLALLIGLTIVMQGVGFALAAFFYLQYRGLPFTYVRLRWPTIRDAIWTVVGLVGLLGTLVVINVVLTWLGLADVAEHEIVAIGQDNPSILLLLVPLSILVIGPGEELLFRGVIQTRLVEAYGLGGGIGATSAVFAIAHVPAYGGEQVGVVIVSLFVLSLVLGGVYEYTENLLVPALVHGLYNAILFLGLYLYVTGVIG